MKKAKFDISMSSHVKGDAKEYKDALRAMKDYEPILKAYPEKIKGHWVGMRNGKPYFMVTVESGKTRKPDKLLPDKLGKYSVYYVAGRLRLKHR